MALGVWVMYSVYRYARAGERFRLRSPPAIRVTVSTLDVTEADRLADDIGAAMAPRRRTRLA